MLRKYCAYFVVETAFDGETKEKAGFYPANTFGEAMDYIEEYFGDELCVVKHLEIVDSAMITMPVECAEKALEHVFGQGG